MQWSCCNEGSVNRQYVLLYTRRNQERADIVYESKHSEKGNRLPDNFHKEFTLTVSHELQFHLLYRIHSPMSAC